MKFSDYLKKTELNEKKLGIVWQFKSKEDFKNFVEEDKNNTVWGPTKDKEEALLKVEQEADNWIIAKVENRYYGVAGELLDPEKFEAKKLNESFLIEAMPRGIHDEIGKFWVLDNLSPERFENGIPLWIDVLFVTDLHDFSLQARGGLDINRIEGVFKSRPDAVRFVKKNHPEAFELLK